MEHEHPVQPRDVCHEIKSLAKDPYYSDGGLPNFIAGDKIREYALTEFENIHLPLMSAIAKNPDLNSEAATQLNNVIEAKIIQSAEWILDEVYRHDNLKEVDQCDIVIDTINKYTVNQRREIENLVVESLTYVPPVLKRDVELNNPAYRREHFENLYDAAISVVTMEKDHKLSFQVTKDKNSLHLLIELMREAMRSLLQSVFLTTNPSLQAEYLNAVFRMFMTHIRYIKVSFSVYES